MGKVKLSAGAEVDFLTPEEHARHLKATLNWYRKLLKEEAGETVVRAAGSFVLDANGSTVIGFSDLAHDVYRVPNGFTAYLTRLSVDYESSNATSPIACDCRVVADTNTPASLRAITNTLPNVFTESKSHAAIFRGGQRIMLSVTGATAGLSLYVTVQVLLVQRTALDTDVELGD